ncbi:2'-5'-oligoadenylate synthase 1-like isoform X1 [Erinaceus europaeus]|uniref:2'-5'-oligoadenylate synthase 1-like isoform X1 n=1 Tax=Erinaceus europaeus TaxID=9365 RepID=A0ABM3XJP5_ERIEU|nr:2'-5'-oligoadenylate synthase 1-like isoform X1 [Erinaceus europaeus]
MADLIAIPAGDLDAFIRDHLLPDTPFRRQVRAAVHTLSTFLQRKPFPGALYPVRVSKVLKGSSSGQDKALVGRADAHLLVVFLDEIKTFEAQLHCRGEFIKEIRRRLEAYQREKMFGVEFEIQEERSEDPHALCFTLRPPGQAGSREQLEFNVLLAFDILGHWNGRKPKPQIYIRLIQECQNLKAEGTFSSCFTELRGAFFTQLPAKLKSLLHLVKHWFLKCQEERGGPLPPQYALELLTVYAWERGRQRKDFVTAEGFRTVLELVLSYRWLLIYWKRYYNLQNSIIKEYLQKQLRKRRPVILDPADPTGNVAGEDLCAWARLAEEAHTWLSYPCCRNSDGSPVKAWGVQTKRRQSTKRRTVRRRVFKGDGALLDSTLDSPSVPTVIGRQVLQGGCPAAGDRQPTSGPQTPGKREQDTHRPLNGHTSLPKNSRPMGANPPIFRGRRAPHRSKRAKAIAHTRRHTLPRRCPSLGDIQTPREERKALNASTSSQNRPRITGAAPLILGWGSAVYHSKKAEGTHPPSSPLLHRQCSHTSPVSPKPSLYKITGETGERVGPGLDCPLCTCQRVVGPKKKNTVGIPASCTYGARINPKSAKKTSVCEIKGRVSMPVLLHEC